MVEKGIRGGIYHAIYQYAKGNNKYIKDYDKNKESSYLKYWDVNNEDFMKNYNEESDKAYFLKVDIQYPEKVHELHNDLLFLSERMKIEKDEKLLANSRDKTKYVIHIRN